MHIVVESTICLKGTCGRHHFVSDKQELVAMCHFRGGVREKSKLNTIMFAIRDQRHYFGRYKLEEIEIVSLKRWLQLQVGGHRNEEGNARTTTWIRDRLVVVPPGARFSLGFENNTWSHWVQILQQTLRWER